MAIRLVFSKRPGKFKIALAVDLALPDWFVAIMEKVDAGMTRSVFLLSGEFDPGPSCYCCCCCTILVSMSCPRLQ